MGRFSRVLQIGMVFLGLACFLSCAKQESKPTVPPEKKSPATTSAKGPIKIGVTMPLTGPQAEMGQDLLRGIKLAVKQINDGGGILGSTLDLVIEDDQADPKTAVSVANKFVSSTGIFAIVGHMNSGTTLPAAPIYARAGIPVIMPVPTNPEITNQGHSNLFRIPPTDNMQGPRLGRYAVDTMGLKRIAVIDDKSTYGRGISEAFTASVGPTYVVHRDSVDRGQTDFRAVLSKIKDLRVDGILFAGDYPEGSVILKQAREVGLTTKFLMGDGCYTKALIENSDGAAEGVTLTFIAPPWTSSGAAQKFLDVYKKEYGNPPMSFAPLGYDAVMVFSEGLSKSGAIDRAKFISTLHQPGFVYQGVTSKIHFDTKGDNTGAMVYVYKVSNGEFVYME